MKSTVIIKGVRYHVSQLPKAKEVPVKKTATKKPTIEKIKPTEKPAE